MSNRYPKAVRRYIKRTGALAHKKFSPEQTYDCFTQKDGAPLTVEQVKANDFRMAIYPDGPGALVAQALLNGEPVKI